MSHSHPSRVSQTMAADVSQRPSAAVNTPSTAASSTAVPVEAPAQPVDALMLAIRADAARDAAGYLRSTTVPFGG